MSKKTIARLMYGSQAAIYAVAYVLFQAADAPGVTLGFTAGAAAACTWLAITAEGLP